MTKNGIQKWHVHYFFLPFIKRKFENNNIILLFDDTLENKIKNDNTPNITVISCMYYLLLIMCYWLFIVHYIYIMNFRFMISFGDPNNFIWKRWIFVFNNRCKIYCFNILFGFICQICLSVDNDNDNLTWLVSHIFPKTLSTVRKTFLYDCYYENKKIKFIY